MIRRNKRGDVLWLAAIALCCVLLTACNGAMKPGSTTNDTIVLAPAPDFNADSAYSYVEMQCSFGARVPNTEAHRLCGDWLVGKFESFGAQVREQRAEVSAFDGTVLSVRNVIASFNLSSERRLLVCGHWDSRPWADQDADKEKRLMPVLAANDAASDVAVMLEMARLININKVKIGVDFICFDAEDYGAPEWSDTLLSDGGWCLGSQYWAANLHTYGYKPLFGILLDMVGGDGTIFACEGYSLRYAPQVVDYVWATAAQLGYGDVFVRQERGYITDDHVAVNEVARIPCIDIVAYYPRGASSFGPTWHTSDDTPAHISRSVLEAAGQTVLQVIYNINSSDDTK